ncbi:MAG TPA: hypothetical protein ENN19_07470 [Chloroflexi bacterium]|nr:hypothetical protein [Chloroflexota bacterium]
MLGLEQAPTATPAVDVTITPDQPTQQAPPFATPFLDAAPGSSRENPVPSGSSIDVDDMTISINRTIRPADEIVASANPFNPTPQLDNEYLMMSVTLTCNKDSDDVCSIYLSRLTVVGSTGIRREPEVMIAGLPNLLSTQEFFGGAQLDGDIIFEVGQGESDLLVVYEALFGDSVYIALPG